MAAFAGPDLLPPNASPLQKALSAAASRSLGIDAEVICRGACARTAPAHLLPYLGWERSVDEYPESWSLAQKRGAVAGSFAYHAVKGTPAALKRALQAIDYDCIVREWPEFGGAAYTFRLGVTLAENEAFPADALGALVRICNKAKNVRSKLDRIELDARAAGPGPRLATWIAQDPPEITLYPYEDEGPPPGSGGDGFDFSDSDNSGLVILL